MYFRFLFMRGDDYLLLVLLQLHVYRPHFHSMQEFPDIYGIYGIYAGIVHWMPTPIVKICNRCG